MKREKSKAVALGGPSIILLPFSHAYDFFLTPVFYEEKKKKKRNINFRVTHIFHVIN